MKHEEASFEGVNGFKIYYQSWKPDSDKPKASILVCHGAAEHSGRYLNVINTLVPAGYIIYAYDLQGHGKSEGERGFVERFSDYIENLHIFRQIVQEQEPNLPLFILGHSMGSFIAQQYVASHPKGLNGLILSASGTRIGENINILLVLPSKIVTKLAPRKSIDPKLYKSISRDNEVAKA
ncbi:MAG: alpha/beta fold hydrolase, partial [Candidatus Hodarchaeota archaeon]